MGLRFLVNCVMHYKRCIEVSIMLCSILHLFLQGIQNSLLSFLHLFWYLPSFYLMHNLRSK